MIYLKRLVRRIQRVIFPTPPKRMAPFVPYVLTITDIPPKTLRFQVLSRTEEGRINTYGNEREALELFLDRIKPEDVIFDIGASIGLYAVAAAARITQGHVYAFEPDPGNFARLQDNLRLNESTATAIGWAVSDGPGKMILYSNGADGLAPSFYQRQDYGGLQGQVEVETRALDDAIQSGDLPLPHIVKLDVEGAEGFCLRGAQSLMSGKFGPPPRLVLLELHPLFLQALGEDADDVLKIMDSWHYTITWKHDREDQIHLLYEYQPQS